MRVFLRCGNEEIVELKLLTKADLMFWRQNEFSRDMKKPWLAQTNRLRKLQETETLTKATKYIMGICSQTRYKGKR